ncbi:P-loop containing nucleoside triphosphate hydrolase protein [Xylariomycetidae sp. FL2044]|nr:P-loop containing nucleoside triphosphate hydrolase protein [Xylariomycetidae sp. FL2044]
MSDYDSGDELPEDLDVDTPVAGAKRPHSSNDSQPGKRIKTEQHPTDQNDQFSTIARTILKENFGYDDFRHEQAAAINSVLRGENVLVVFPTGAGKSLCYQIPGMAFPELDSRGLSAPRSGYLAQGAGLTIVVSPLIALIKDQVDALLRRGISAACLDSTKTWEQQKETTAAMREGRLRLLYCAPERLNNETFVESMKYVPGGIRLVAVDEAHCISEWGHSFRPDYLKVARFVQEIRAERVICLTATATPRVAQDIRDSFQVEESNMFRTSPYRPNLKLLAEVAEDKNAKYPKLFKFLHQHPGSTLIYVTLQYQAESLAEDLRDQGFDATAFHAGMKTDIKTNIQDDFMSGKSRIVVATIAFGMGIDKADIRNILHFDLPSTVEEYSQQIGRAGRDGKESTCMIYLCRDDFYIRENFARGDLPSRDSLYSLLQDLFSRETVRLPDGGRAIRLNQTSLGREYDMRPSPLGILLATLELRFGLIRAITPEYSSYKFEDRGTYYRQTKIDQSAESKAIFKHAKKASKWYSINVTEAAKVSSVLRGDLIRKLQEWSDRGYILLKTSGVENRYRILKELPRTPKQLDPIFEKLYADMEAREEDALKRTHQVSDMITAKQCFALSLAQHFGMGLPGEKATQCGHCTFCMGGGKPVVLPPAQKPAVNIAGIERVLKACDVRDDPRFLARVAFGIKSPRVGELKLDKSPVFMSLADHDFKSLLKEFTRACDEANKG